MAGLFFDPDALSQTERRTLEAFAASHGLKCMTRTAFVEDVSFRRGYELRARSLASICQLTSPAWR